VRRVIPSEVDTLMDSSPLNGMSSLQIYIISWKGMHPQAAHMAKALAAQGLSSVVVYSDPDDAVKPDTDARTIRRPDHLFFGDKFQACLDDFSGEHLLVMHADCDCQDWAQLAQRCHQVLSQDHKVWMWVPQIRYTGFGLERTRIMDLPHSSLVVAAHGDTIVFGLHRQVVERLKQSKLEDNVYGWGVGWLAAAYAYANQHCVVIDRSVQVAHPQSRGYDTAAANAQRDRYLQQTRFEEKVQLNLLSSHMALQDVKLSRRGSTS
jgi:hypothetical protein